MRSFWRFMRVTRASNDDIEKKELEEAYRLKKNYTPRIPQKGTAMAVNEGCCMDFVSNRLYNGKRSRAPTMSNTVGRESLPIHVDKPIWRNRLAKRSIESRSLSGSRSEARRMADSGPPHRHWTPDLGSPSRPASARIRRRTTRISNLTMGAFGPNA